MTNQVSNQVQIFNNETFGEVRTFRQGEEILFVAVDVCRALEIRNARDAVSRLDEDEKGVAIADTLGGQQTLNAINECGLYHLVLISRKPEAKAFKRWITHEVIPAIRKHGGYLTPEKVEEALLNPDTLIKLASQLKLERAKRKEAETKRKEAETKLAIAKPKASYYDEYMNREETFSVSDVADTLGLTYQRLYKHLCMIGWLCKPVGCSHQVTAQAPDGVFKICQALFKGKARGVQIRVTPKGVKEIQALFDK